MSHFFVSWRAEHFHNYLDAAQSSSWVIFFAHTASDFCF